MAVKDWSTNESSNSAILSGLTLDGMVMTIPQIDNAIRVMAADIAAQLGKFGYKGADIASASTTDLSTATGWYVDVTGTTTITSFGTVAAGQPAILSFTGALTLTHNATSLILPGGGNITTAAGDVAWMISRGSGNWRCVMFQRASGASQFGSAIQSGTLVDVSIGSPTAINFTSIPSWAKRINVFLRGVSVSGSSPVIVQIGDSGGIETSGYTGALGNIATSTATGAANPSSGLQVVGGGSSVARYGTVTIELVNAATFTWMMTGIVGDSNDSAAGYTAADKSTSAALDRVRITTVGGTNTFTGGTINITWE